jgi:hypothetical protein
MSRLYDGIKNKIKRLKTHPEAFLGYSGVQAGTAFLFGGSKLALTA